MSATNRRKRREARDRKKAKKREERMFALKVAHRMTGEYKRMLPQTLAGMGYTAEEIRALRRESFRKGV